MLYRISEESIFNGLENMFPATPIKSQEKYSDCHHTLDAHKKLDTYTYLAINKMKRDLLCPNVWLFPVMSRVTGQEPVLLHEPLGKSPYEVKSVLTARNCCFGICSNGGHSGG